MSTHNKAQLWSLDFIIAVSVFVVVLFIFLQYQTNVTSISIKSSDVMFSEAEYISGHLVTAGSPENWSIDDVLIIGLTDGNFRIEDRKLQDFYSLAANNYTYSKRLFLIQNDFTIFFQNKNASRVSVGGIYEIGKNITSENPKNIITIERFLIHDSEPVKMVVQVW